MWFTKKKNRVTGALRETDLNADFVYQVKKFLMDKKSDNTEIK